MKNIHLSIIISVYNGEEFISQTIDSIIDQGIQDYECIIINDGSSDRTDIIVNDYLKSHPNFKYYYKENGGYVSARNFGFSMSDKNSKYIHFMDADDVLSKDYYATLISFLENNQSASAVCCNHDLIDTKGLRIGSSNYSPFFIPTRFGYKILCNEEFKIPFISIFCWGKIIEPMVIIRKTAYKNSSGWDERFGKGKGNIGDGIILFGEIALKGEIWFVNQVLYHYRKHPNQSTSDQNLNQRAQEKVLAIWEEKYKDGVLSKSEFEYSKSVFKTRFEIMKLSGRLKHELRYSPIKLLISITNIFILFIKSIHLVFYSNKKVLRLF